MGCDIHIVAQRKTENGYEDIEGNFSEGPVPFDWRSYNLFGFLADVRNYSAIKPIAEPRGLPEDLKLDADDEFKFGDHSYSWLSVIELLEFNYDEVIEDRRVFRQIATNMNSGGITADPGQGEITTYREFLGELFFNDLAELKRINAYRIVFGFDS